MKKFYLLLGMAFSFCCLLNFSFAQGTPASATWPLTDPGTGGTGKAVITTGQMQASTERLVNMNINQYTGTEGSQRVRIDNNNWPLSQTDTVAGTYVQFAVGPSPNSRLTVRSIALKLGAHSTNAMKANVYYSTDRRFKNVTQIEYSTTLTNNVLSTSALTPVSATTAITLQEGDSLYVRVYPWVNNATTTQSGKYLTLKDVTITGESEATAVPSSIVWNSDQTFSTTGAVVGTAPAYSPAMQYYGTTNLPTTDTNENVTVAAIQTVSQDWQAEPNPVESLYFQYAVSPKTGATLNITNVSLYIGGWFSSNLRAAIYYSKDPTFAERTLLVEDMDLVGNKVAPVSATLNATINSGETFYLRIYPHNKNAEGWAKLVAVYNVTLSGSAIGVTFDPPAVTTVTPASDISTTFATVKGNISSDGGAAVTARGIAYGTSENPTVDGTKTTAGEGSGAFSSQLTGLTPGTTYYARAYATNTAGTSYGEQVSFSTLAELAVPTVTTTAASGILATSAQSGGNVTAWGGVDVTARGLVWNTTGNPTLADNKSVDGAGLGSFSSQLHSLTANTTYYVRAYATNSQGTGYGPEVTFTTQQQAPDVTKVVAKDGSGDYTTVQAAFNAVPDFYTGKWTILVKPGTYKEKLILERNKVNVILRGENPLNTILTYDDYAGKNNLGTSGSYSVAIEADDFIAANITFQNTKRNDNTAQNEQAVALRVNGDRQAYYNCRILGYQDTFYAWGGRVVGRIYMKDCYIEGSVDFIFGRDIVVFDNCTINVNRNGGMLTAASTEANTRHGFVFLNSTVTADEVGFDGVPITSFHLGRPWQAAPRTVFMNTFLPASLNAAGWQTWNVTPALYGEYNNSGPGAATASRISISRVLTAQEAAEHTIANIFSKETHPAFSFDWMPENVSFPVTGLAADKRNSSFSLEQNYPNPFHTATTIAFELKKASHVTLEVYDITGKRVALLAEGLKTAGVHEVKLDSNTLQNGIYFYKLSAGGATATRKMVITR
ncbi:pectinesterase family protein [Botryobacter ruber]|uniref:pectinesterase family protein n=1 Tax=Botryobacter ruber TaxID=2171629 RepID=UPI000F65182E|nr:pectinesterase family protein [Botryobacter ruber]